MHILCVGDLHIRIRDCLIIDELEQKLESECARHQPDAIVLLGDILHTFEKLHTLEMNRASRLFGTLARFAPLYVLVGNHDYIRNDEFQSANHWMYNAVPSGHESSVEKQRVTIIDRAQRHGDLVFIPYVPKGRLEEALSGVDMNGCKCVFAHQEFRGARMNARGSFFSPDGDIWPEDAPLVISGHIHGTQQVGRNVYYPGMRKAILLTLPEGSWDMLSLLEKEEPGVDRPSAPSPKSLIFEPQRQTIKDAVLERILQAQDASLYAAFESVFNDAEVDGRDVIFIPIQ